MLISVDRFTQALLAEQYGFVGLDTRFGGLAVPNAHKELASGLVRLMIDTRKGKIYLVKDKNPSQDHVDVALEALQMTRGDLKADPSQGEHMVSAGIVLWPEGIGAAAIGMGGSFEPLIGRHREATLTKARVMLEAFIRAGDVPLSPNFEIRVLR